MVPAEKLSTPVSAADVDRVLSGIDRFRLITLCRNLIKIPSYNGEETAKAQYVMREMERRGLEVVEAMLEPDRPNVLGILRGEGTGRSLMLAAHLDTHRPLEGQEEIAHTAKVENGRIYGVGAGDSMPPMAAYFAAIDAIRRAGVRLRGDVVLLTSVDEMVFDEGARLLVDSGIKADMCIIGETTDFNVGVVHPGKTEMEIRAKGRAPVELSSYGEALGMKTVNAVLSMARIIDKLQQMTREEPYFNRTHPLLPGKGAALSIGTVIGGSSGFGSPYRRPGKGRDERGVGKQTPTWCNLRIRIWQWPGQTQAESVALVRKWIGKAKEEDPNVEADVEVYLDGDLNSAVEVPHDSEVVQVLRESITHVLGREPKLVGNVYCTEAPQYQRAGIPVAWCGHGTARFGTPDEHITIDELVDLCRIFTTAILKVCA